MVYEGFEARTKALPRNHHQADGQGEELYGKVDSLGEPIPINVEPAEVPDACPEDAEIRAAVRGLRTGRIGNTRGARACCLSGRS